MRGTHLEEHEGGPLQLLRALGRLDEASEAGLPDLQHKEGRGDTLWEEPHRQSQEGAGRRALTLWMTFHPAGLWCSSATCEFKLSLF